MKSLFVILGPTATGKTSLSIELISRLGGEVISADSRQVYRGFDIGSGKILLEEMRGIPHHMINIRDPWESYSVQEFQQEACQIIDDLHELNQIPWLVGGTGLYIEAITKGYNIPQVKPNLSLRAKLQKKSLSELQAILQSTAPDITLNNSDNQNPVRLIRAIEKQLNGFTPSKTSSPLYHTVKLGLTTSLPDLKSRIIRRVQNRLDQGVIEEVQTLYQELVDHLGKKAGLAKLKTFGLGTLVILQYLNDEMSYDQMFQRFITKEYQYAKRQLTWFRRDPEIRWIEVNQLTKSHAIDQLSKELKRAYLL